MVAGITSLELFGKYPPKSNGGVNPPYAPPYPHEWSADCHRVDIVTTVDTDYLDSLLSVTPFTRVGDRVIFRYADMRGHTLALETNGFTETMVVAPVRYRDLLTYTYVYHYTDNEIANTAGRELLGYSKKNALTSFQETGERIEGVTTLSTGEELTTYGFQFDESAPTVTATPDETHAGSIHVRRLPYPDRLADAYADVIYRQYRFAGASSLPGRATLRLGSVASDPMHKLSPVVIGASYSRADFGGSLDTEVRGVLEVLTTPEVMSTSTIRSEIGRTYEGNSHETV